MNGYAPASPVLGKCITFPSGLFMAPASEKSSNSKIITIGQSAEQKMESFGNFHNFFGYQSFATTQPTRKEYNHGKIML